MVVPKLLWLLKKLGVMSSGYKNYIADKGLNSDGVALIRISGTSPHNNKVVQVEVAATSLNQMNVFCCNLDLQFSVGWLSQPQIPRDGRSRGATGVGLKKRGRRGLTD